MKSGDIIALRGDRVIVRLLSDIMEHKTDVKKIILSGENDTIVFRRGDIGTVIEINEKNSARVKILYESSMWWGNVSDFLVIE